MTQDEIIALAGEAGFEEGWVDVCNVREELTNLYNLGRAHEREACAKVCEEISQDHWNLYKGRPPYTGSETGRADPHEQGVSMGASDCATAIRARGEK